MALGIVKKATTALTLIATLSHAALAAPCAEDAMLVFDGSGSMAERTYGRDGGTRIRDARSALQRALPEVTLYRDVGLLVYGPGEGPGEGNGCSGINVAFGPRHDSAVEIIMAINEVNPTGLTPLAASVERAAQAMDYRNKPAILVVVTDGFDTCGGSTCELAERLSRESAGLQIHVVGFNLPAESIGYGQRTSYQDTTRCMSEATGGMYVATRTIDELTQALNMTLGCMLVAGREIDMTLPRIQ